MNVTRSSRRSFAPVVLGFVFLLSFLATAPPGAAQAAPRLSINVLVEGESRPRGGTGGEWLGTKGAARPILGFSIGLVSPPPGLGLEYQCHVADLGDSSWNEQDEWCGHMGGVKQLESFIVRLTGPLRDNFDLRYGCHLADIGDRVASGGQPCGTTGENRRIEAMFVTLERKAVSLSEGWESLASWQTTGDASVGFGQLLLRGNPSIASVYRTDFEIPHSYELGVLAKVDSYTAGAENLGFKVSDGVRRLMFQRRSDGFYAITSSSGGAWVHVRPTSEYTGWGEYRFTVTNGEVSLTTRRWPNGSWDGPTTWTLPQHGADDRVEVWLKGAPGDAHLDSLTFEPN